jgi:hypothetical protein
VAALTAWDVPLPPFATALAWLIVLGVRVVRRRDPARTLELVPVACSAVLVQLLLDLRAPWLGDVAVAACHAVAAAVWVVRRRRR